MKWENRTPISTRPQNTRISRLRNLSFRNRRSRSNSKARPVRVVRSVRREEKQNELQNETQDGSNEAQSSLVCFVLQSSKFSLVFYEQRTAQMDYKVVNLQNLMK